jgi:phospho-N-acetylmuramoyl-pentapeptide-transferase
VPRFGGVLVWGSVTIVALLLAVVSFFADAELFQKLSFLSRNQTWVPLATLILGGLVGAIDDYLVCRDQGTFVGGGLSVKARLLHVFVVALLAGWWFYVKLGVSTIAIPFSSPLVLGPVIIALFVVVMIGLYTGGIIDGVDGLAGGLYAIMYGAFGVIAFYHTQYDLAAFAMAVAGALLAFLWFNIPPARFFLSETGTMGLSMTLVVIAFLTDSVVVLPIIALPLIVTSASVVIQLLSKRFRNGKKVFLIAPLHNHFQALGWPATKVTMRYWVIGAMCAILGVIIALVG